MTSVDIFGRRYNIEGQHEPKTIRALAEHVDRRMQQIASQVAPGDTVGVAVLAALNIADEYYRTRRTLDRREDEIRERTQGLADRLAEALDPMKRKTEPSDA